MPQRVLCCKCKQILYEGTKICLAEEIARKNGGECPMCGRKLFFTPLDAEVKPANKEKVFIVHGTDHFSLKELKSLIHNSGLNPIILHELPNKGLTIIEKLEKYSNVSFAFIILTPDDIGAGKTDGMKVLSKLVGKNNPNNEEVDKFIEDNPTESFKITSALMALNKGRARQNVIMEFGYFIGKLGRSNVCCLYRGDIELPSDMHGVCYLHFENSIMEVRDSIIQELAEERFIQFSI